MPACDLCPNPAHPCYGNLCVDCFVDAIHALGGMHHHTINRQLESPHMRMIRATLTAAGKHMSRGNMWIVRDWAISALATREQQASDDETPVDEAWFLSVVGSDIVYSPKAKSLRIAWNKPTSKAWLCSETDFEMPLPNQGDIRSVAAALGIELKC